MDTKKPKTCSTEDCKEDAQPEKEICTECQKIVDDINENGIFAVLGKIINS